MWILFALIHSAAIAWLIWSAYRAGRRSTREHEVRTMIELMDLLKVDCYEQVVFRDRLKSALQWTLDGKTRSQRNAGS